MGNLIPLPQRLPATKNVVAKRIHLERQRALAHAQMMMVGAMAATGLMMLGLFALTLVN